MSINFSEHAKSQLKRRKISQKDVKEAVYISEDIISSIRGRRLRRKLIGDKMLEVVTRTEGSKITVITAYYLKKQL